MKYLWRAVDHEGEVLESFVTTERDKAAALKFMRKLMKRHGYAKAITTDGLRSYKAAMKELGIAERQEVGRWANNRAENSHQPFRRRERAILRFRRVTRRAAQPTRCGSSLPSTLPSTTTSTRNVTSSAAKPTRRDAQPLWPSGAQSRARASSGLSQLRLSGDLLPLD